MDSSAMESGMASEPKPETAPPSDRSVHLTDMEMKSLAGKYQPGQEVSCEVTGRISGEGKLDIIEIRPSGPVETEPQMPMKMNPMMAPS